MNYQEAIKKLQYIKRGHIPDCGNKQDEYYPIHEAVNIAISAMQELQEYKHIGTLDDLKKLKERELSGYELAKIACSLNLVEKYKQIGTLDEVREAVGKWNECKNCGYKIHSDRIGKLNSCNDCGLVNTCVNRPEYGDYCRINCYDWIDKNER